MKLLVLIAQAHAKSTPGKRSPDGRLREYAWSREITKMITEKLYRHGIKTVIINPEENEVKLSVQAARANNIYHQNKNLYDEIILISPHINAAKSDGKWHDANGWTGWVYTKAGKKSRQLAKIFADFAYDEYKLQGNRWIPEKKYFEANYTILKQTVMPAILTENMFQDNKADVEYLMSEEGKETLSSIHVNSILKYKHTLENQ